MGNGGNSAETVEEIRAEIEHDREETSELDPVTPEQEMERVARQIRLRRAEEERDSIVDETPHTD